MTKGRLSASIDADLLAAAQAAVSAGRAASVSDWVGSAMRRQLQHEARLTSLAAFVAAYEAEHGVITEEEMSDATRRLRADAEVIRGRPASRRTGAA